VRAYMNKVDEAMSSFREGFNCSQSILSTYCSEFGLDRKIALKLSTGFGSGMGGLAKICGAVSGSFMVIGLKYGRAKIEDIEAKERTYNKVQDFVKQFENIYGSIICKELIGCDISTQEGKKIAQDQNLFKEKCPKFVKEATKILEHIL